MDGLDDLISRQAVKELAHNQVREKYCGAALKGQRDFYIKLADSIIDLLPSAQPEIIRCRECKFASGDSRICMKFDHSPIGELDFCSFAERRTDG